MIRLFFGLPGSGKTTLMCHNIIKDLKCGRYKHVYTNVRVKIPGCTVINDECIGKYDLSDCALHVDEATLFADSRDFKNLSKSRLTFLLEHRHFKCDISFYTQQWDGLDRKIRVITDRCYYVYKAPLTGWYKSKWYRVPYGIIIPDPKKDGSEKLGEIVQGYCKPSLFSRLFFGGSIKRKKYYKYFDSFEKPPGFAPLPDDYKPYVEPSSEATPSADQDHSLSAGEALGASAPAEEP